MDTRRPTELRIERLDAGMTQRDLAEATGLPLSTIYRLEIGKDVHIPPRDAEQIAAALGVPVEQLFESGKPR